jgi:hypothetical protein
MRKQVIRRTRAHMPVGNSREQRDLPTPYKR